MKRVRRRMKKKLCLMRRLMPIKKKQLMQMKKKQLMRRLVADPGLELDDWLPGGCDGSEEDRVDDQELMTEVKEAVPLYHGDS